MINPVTETAEQIVPIQLYKNTAASIVRSQHIIEF
jgi:hypothetical protein